MEDQFRNSILTYMCRALEILPAKNLKNVLVFIGSTSTNQAVKGYVRTPKKKLERALHDWAYVRRVWELRSTMLCSTCFESATTSRSPHRWQYCKKCATVWNRDVNAGRNILYLGLTELMGEAVHQGFSRRYNFEFTANHYKYPEAGKPNTLPWTRRWSRRFRNFVKHYTAVN